MKYYAEDKVNILTMLTDYTLDNLSYLFKLAKVLAINMFNLYNVNVII